MVHDLAWHLGIVARRISVTERAVAFIDEIRIAVADSKSPLVVRPQALREVQLMNHLGGKFLGSDFNPMEFAMEFAFAFRRKLESPIKLHLEVSIIFSSADNARYLLAEIVDIPDIDDDIFVHDLSHAMQFFAASQTNNKIFKRVAK